MNKVQKPLVRPDKNMYGTATSEYFELVMKEMMAVMPLKNAQVQREMGQEIMNIILGKSGPAQISKKPSRRENFIANEIFRPMFEIQRAMQAIENIAVYIRYFPYKKQGISRLSYMQYHVEGYLNEVYILKNRLEAYLNILQKAYGKSGRKAVSKTITPLYPLISNAFRTYAVVRGSHVHQLRLSDPQFYRLSTLELLSTSQDEFGPSMRPLFLAAYRTARKSWSDKIQNDVQAIRKLLDLYFGQLRRAIVQGGKLLIPRNYT